MQLVNIYRRFFEVDEIHLSSNIFGRVVLHRNNYFYDFLLKICRIIFDNILIDEKTGKYAFKDFLREDKKMAVVFESFVRNFYSREQKVFTSSVELINWNAIAIKGSEDSLPKMKTDISLESKDRKIIIDTKYYGEALTTHYDKQTFRSSNIFQINAYLTNIEAKGGINEFCEGILLYPTVETELDEMFLFNNKHTVTFKSLNLNQPWQGIHKDLMSIIA
jgi:5-methylcytosine-specific restriction enzyme subunit McrC